MRGSSKHRITVVAMDGVIAGDLAAPIDIFGHTRHTNGRAAYEVRVCAPDRHARSGHFTLDTEWDLDALEDADTIFVPGRAHPTQPTDPRVLVALQDAAARGARLASICVGAFTLAEAGVLDGLRATTHWSMADELARRYPTITVDPNVLFVDNGQILTSAGAAAGMDLCLHMIRRDLGASIATQAARAAVMPLERAGGQAQFIVPHPPIPDGSTLEPLLRWLEEHLDTELTLEQIATQAAMSTRTLNRRFREQTGTTPHKWLHHARMRRAQELLERTDRSVAEIALGVGFGSAITFRDRFRQLIGTSPHAYRRAFRGSAAD